MIVDAIKSAAIKKNISRAEAEAVMNEIMSGEASEIQMAAYLAAMSAKGETIEEIIGSAEGMRKHCVRLLHDMDVLEIVGTGGDMSNSFNISTTSAIVISAAGIPVAKHGNRAASSKCGAADVLEALGVRIDISPESSLALLQEIGLCFLFAQNYHIAMKYVAPVRRELGIRTMFNILGPLVNPAGAMREVLGVYEEDLVEPMAKVLVGLGVRHAFVVHGTDGLDEISISAPTVACEVRDGFIRSFEMNPENYGMSLGSKADLAGGTPKENAEILRRVLGGERGAKRDAVLLNSAAAIHVGRPEVSIEDGIALAAEMIDSGKATTQLERFIELSNSKQD